MNMKELIKDFFSKIDITKLLIGITVMSCFVIVTLALIYIPIPQGNENILYMLIGSIATYMGSLVNYSFGSSEGSKKKSDLIEKMTDTTTKK